MFENLNIQKKIFASPCLGSTLDESVFVPTSSPTPTRRASPTTSAPPSKPTYSGRKAKRGEALLDDQGFVDYKKKKIELEVEILECQVREISEKAVIEKHLLSQQLEESAARTQLLSQQLEESAARTSYFKAATKAIHLKIGDPQDQSFNEE